MAMFWSLRFCTKKFIVIAGKFLSLANVIFNLALTLKTFSSLICHLVILALRLNRLVLILVRSYETLLATRVRARVINCATIAYIDSLPVTALGRRSSHEAFHLLLRLNKMGLLLMSLEALAIRQVVTLHPVELLSHVHDIAATSL